MSTYKAGNHYFLCIYSHHLFRENVISMDWRVPIQLKNSSSDVLYNVKIFYVGELEFMKNVEEYDTFVYIPCCSTL